MPTSHLDLIRQTASAATRLAKALVRAADVQYLRPAGPSTRGEDPARSKGTISNPTMDIATDERRLALRAAVIEGELLFEKFIADAHQASERLEAALLDWAGTRA